MSRSVPWRRGVAQAVVYGYLPTALAAHGTAVEVEYFGRRYAATVTADPLFDPKSERLKT